MTGEKSDTLVKVPEGEWAALAARMSHSPAEVWRSRGLLVQVFRDEHPHVTARLTVNRTEHNGKRWTDGLAWESLQEVKNLCGYAFLDAVEIYPDARHTVNVANMRHLWVLRDPVPFKWIDGVP